MILRAIPWLIGAALAACATFPRDQLAQAYVGRWVGKWDDTWCVQFTITVDELTKRLQLVYEWEENLNGPLWRSVVQARLDGQRLTAGNVDLEISPSDRDQATAYGRFPTPRTAKLRRTTAQGCRPSSDPVIG